MSRRPSRRGVLLTLGTILLVLVAAPFIAVRFVDSESVKQRVIDRLREATGYAIEAGPASTGVGLRGIRFTVDSLAVVSPDGSQRATVDRVDATLQLWPLLKKKVELDRVVLDAPVVVMEARERTTNELSGSPVLAFLGVRRWEVRSGVFRRSAPGGGFEASGIDVSGSYRWDPETGSEIAARGEIGALRQGGASPDGALGPVTLDTRMLVDPKNTSLVVDLLQLAMEDLQVGFTGTFLREPGGWVGELEGAVEPAPLAVFLKLGGAERSQALAVYEPQGTLTVGTLTVGLGPAGTRVSGEGVLTEASAVLGPGAREAVRGAATFRFDQDGGTITSSALRIGESTLDVTGRWDRPAALWVAGVRGSVKARELDDVLPPARMGGNRLTAGALSVDLSMTAQGEAPSRTAGTMDAANLVITRGGRVFPETSGRVHLDGNVMTLEDVQVELSESPLTAGQGRIVRDGETWVLESFAGNIAGGTVEAVGGWSPGTDAQAEPTLRLSGAMQGVDVSPWTAARLPAGRVSGRLDGTFGFVGVGTETEGFDAGLNFRVSEGAFVGLPVVREVIERLQLTGADPERWRFRDLVGILEVREGRVVVDSLSLLQEGLRWTFGGSVGLDRTLSLDGMLLVDAGRVTFPAGLDVLAQHVIDDSGQVPIDLAVRGTPTSPDILFDWDRFAMRAAERAKDRQTEKLEDLLEDTIKDPGLLDRLKKKLKKPGGKRR